MIDFELDIEAPATTVFRLLTEPDGLTRWMVRAAEIDPRPGGRFRWVYENGDIVVGEFVAVEAPRRLTFRYGWERPADRAVPPDSTLVEITLSERNGTTRLRLAHTGLPTESEREHRMGWEYFLGRLAGVARAQRKPMNDSVREDPMTVSTAATVDAYYAHWGNGDVEGLRRLLADDFSFRGPPGPR
jgi:uncharacterized protein YndB with AHSA1/START domain